MIKKTAYFTLLVGIVTYFISCFEKPLTPVMPEWDVILNIPILKEYTMGEIIDKDTVFSYENSKDSIIQYTSSLRIEPFNPSDKSYLKINTRSSSKKILLSEIKFQPLQSYDFSYSINQIFSGLSIGANSVVPAIGSASKSDESTLSSFQEFLLDSGKMIITINNQFPFDVNYESIRILNNSSDNKTEIGIIRNKTIPSKGFLIDSSITLSGKKVQNRIKVEITISTPGTGGKSVYLSANDMTGINVRFSDFKIRSAIAAFNSQYYSMFHSTAIEENNGNFNIANSTIKSGKLYISIENYTNLGANLKVIFPEIQKYNNTFQINDIYLPANQKIPERIYDLSQSKISPVNGREFSSRTEIYTDGTNNNMISLNGSDSIRYSFRIEDITLESINGQVTSTVSRNFKLPVKEINKYFDGSVDFSTVKVKICLNNGAGLPINIKNANIKGYNRNTGGYESLTIDNATISPRATTIIEPDELKTTTFFNMFSKNNILPETMDFSGNVDINTNSVSYNFTPADTIGGYIIIIIPLRVSLKNVVYKDTFDFSFTDENRKQIDKFNYGRIKLNINSYIPVNFILNIGFYNSSNQSILSLPASNEAEYLISSAQIDNSGNVTNPVVSEFSVDLDRNDILRIKDSKYCEFKIKMNTPSNPYVSFKKSSTIKIKMSTEFGYKVSTQ